MDMSVKEAEHPHSYWKLRVSSLHMDRNEKIWVVGTWFYSPSDLQDIKLSSQ
jgi:hypothetical protein